jgi:hypothetical protein
MRVCEACGITFGKYSYMRWDRLLLLTVGVGFVLLGLFADVFIVRPSRPVRIGVIILGVVAAVSAVWQQWHYR